MPTAAEALAVHYARLGVPGDATFSDWWRCRIGPFNVTLPNWSWRRDAITRHDLHHILTGYSCTMTGEMQIAAWEFAAGRYRHWAATVFCLPLALFGLLVAPTRTARAFRSGLQSNSLYGRELDLTVDIEVLRRACLDRRTVARHD